MKEIDLFDDKLYDEIKKLPYSNTIEENSGIFIPESDYGFGIIYRLYDNILVFLIPMYGGTPNFYKCYCLTAIDALVDDLRKIC